MWGRNRDFWSAIRNNIIECYHCREPGGFGEPRNLQSISTIWAWADTQICPIAFHFAGILDWRAATSGSALLYLLSNCTSCLCSPCVMNGSSWVRATYTALPPLLVWAEARFVFFPHGFVRPVWTVPCAPADPNTDTDVNCGVDVRVCTRPDVSTKQAPRRFAGS